MPGVDEQENRGNNISNPPQIPLEILDQLEQQLSRVDAPFLRFLKKNLSTIWLEESDSRLGMTRFECNHHELFRRRRLASSMPRKRASKLRHTPREQATFDDHLRKME